MNWIPVKEKLPTKRIPVLVSDGKNTWSAYWLHIDNNVNWFCHGFDRYERELDYGHPTHWMPLPEPPSEVK